MPTSRIWLGSAIVERSPDEPMPQDHILSRRTFMGGFSAVLTHGSARPDSLFEAQVPAPWGRRRPAGDYERMAKLNFNENPFGPSDAVMSAMTGAFKYANRYGYPDGGIIVTRTFSKIAALAGMRLGYRLAPRDLIARMSPFASGGVSAIVKWGGVAALQDTAAQARTRKTILELRNKVTGELATLGYAVIPSQGNFFMVHIGRDVTPGDRGVREKGGFWSDASFHPWSSICVFLSELKKR